MITTELLGASPVERIVSGPAPLRSVAVLFARADSVYKTMPAVDVWDIERDARKWPGGSPVVAHPPCRAWGRLAHMAKPRHDEKDLARWAVAQVRRFGGVLEHPKDSKLWSDQGLPPADTTRDEFGGWTLGITQHWWGHRATKATKLYIVGCSPADIPDMPALVLGEGTHVIAQDSRRLAHGDVRKRPECTKAEREQTPPKLATWLVDLSRLVRMPANMGIDRPAAFGGSVSNDGLASTRTNAGTN